MPGWRRLPHPKQFLHILHLRNDRPATRRAGQNEGGSMNTVEVPIQARKAKPWMLWVGWVVSLWPVFVVCSSATWKLTRNAWYVAEFSRIGWPQSALTLLACLQLGAIVLFLIPPTAVLGAV